MARLRFIKWVSGAVLLVGGVLGSAALYVAHPPAAPLALPSPLVAADLLSVSGPYTADLTALARGFSGQRFRSFCGPASLATVLAAYGQHKDQTDVFPSTRSLLETYFTGTSLTNLGALATNLGLDAEIVYARELTLRTFRERLKSNLAHSGDFVIVNYDRRVLRQHGIGHISPVGAYDPQTDRFLVVDEASYSYPFTWVPAVLLYRAANTMDGQTSRGVLFIHGFKSS